MLTLNKKQVSIQFMVKYLDHMPQPPSKSLPFSQLPVVAVKYLLAGACCTHTSDAASTRT